MAVGGGCDVSPLSRIDSTHPTHCLARTRGLSHPFTISQQKCSCARWDGVGLLPLLLVDPR